MKKLIRYTMTYKGRIIQGHGSNPLAARNDAMRQLAKIAPDEPRVQYLKTVVVAME